MFTLNDSVDWRFLSPCLLGRRSSSLLDWVVDGVADGRPLIQLFRRMSILGLRTSQQQPDRCNHHLCAVTGSP